MKTTKRLISAIAIAVLSLIQFNSYSQLIKNHMRDDEGNTMPGYYKTYDDFVKKVITQGPVIVEGTKWYTVVNGKRGDATKWKDGKMWGYVDKQGFTWYLDIKKGMAYRILLTGKVWVYTSDNVNFQTDSNGNVLNVNFSYTQGDNFKSMVYISTGPNAELLSCDKKNLLKLLADDPTICVKINDKGIYVYRDKKWAESLNDVLGWVKDYNDSHK